MLIINFLALTFEPKMLDVQSNALNTHIIAQFPLKFDSKNCRWRPGLLKPG